MRYLTKKIVFEIGVIGSLLLIVSTIIRKTFFSIDGYCYLKYSDVCSTINNITTWNVYNFDNFLIYIFPILLFFSLLTYRMQDEIFKHWVRFAVWGVPTVIIAHTLMYAIFYRNGSPDVFERIVVVPIFILIYGLFIIISIWRIVSKWRELRRE